MSNKEDGRYRPTFLCFEDDKYSEIFWMVPLTTKYDKFKKIKEKQDEKFGDSIGIVLGEYDGKDAAFLVQNAFPVLQEHIDHTHDRKGNPVPVAAPIAEEVRSKLRRLIVLRTVKKQKVGFVDIESIKRLLLEKISK